MFTSKIIRRLSLLDLALVIILFTSCQSNSTSEKNASYGEATRELVEMVDKDPDLKAMLIASIEKAKQINPDTATNPVQSLDEFYAFASRAEASMPWTIFKDYQNPS